MGVHGCTCHAPAMPWISSRCSMSRPFVVWLSRRAPSFSFDVSCSCLVNTFLFRPYCPFLVFLSHATLWTILSFLGSSSYQRLQLSVLSPFALMMRHCAALGPCAAPSLAFHAVPVTRDVLERRREQLVSREVLTKRRYVLELRSTRVSEVTRS
jgi:hypothetical protein